MSSQDSAKPIASATCMWDDGTGSYTRNNLIQQDVYKNIVTAVLTVMDQVTFSGGVFVISDYGVADGGTSMELMNKCIGQLKNKYGKDQEIQLVYEDQPGNDFSILFRKLSGELDGGSGLNYYKQYSNVYVSAVGMSFYHQIVPDNTVNFGFSSTAFHYLSGRPCNLTNGIMLSDETNEKERTLFSEHAARDWLTILRHRTNELAPGGHMLINCVGRDPEGRQTGGRMAKGFEYAVNTCWTQLLNENIITRAEYEDSNIFVYQNRTEDELLAPLRNTESEVYKAGLRLVSISWTFTEDTIKTNWIKNKNSGMTARDQGVAYRKTFQLWSFLIRRGLADTRSEAEKDQIVDTLLDRYEDLVATMPDTFEYPYVHARIHVRKNVTNDL